MGGPEPEGVRQSSRPNRTARAEKRKQGKNHAQRVIPAASYVCDVNFFFFRVLMLYSWRIVVYELYVRASSAFLKRTAKSIPKSISGMEDVMPTKRLRGKVFISSISLKVGEARSVKLTELRYFAV